MSIDERIRPRLAQRLRVDVDRLTSELPHDAVVSAAHRVPAPAGSPASFASAVFVDSDGNLYSLGFMREVEVRPARVSEALQYIESVFDAMVDGEVERVDTAVRAIQPKLREAVLERAIERWPWLSVIAAGSEDGPTFGFSVLRALSGLGYILKRRGEIPEADLSRTAYAMSWPTDVALADAVTWLRETLEGLEKGSGKRYESAVREWFDDDPSRMAPLDLRSSCRQPVTHARSLR